MSTAPEQSSLKASVFRKSALMASVVLIALIMVLSVLIIKVGHHSYDKIEPYSLSIDLEGEAGSRVFLAYDYGFGIQDPHIRPLDLDEAVNRFDLSLSAWKRISALYFIAPKDVQYRVNDLSIRKNGVSFSPKLPSNGPTLEGDNWLTRLPLVGFEH